MIELTLGVYLIYGLTMLGDATAICVWKGRLLASLIWSFTLGPIGWIIVALGPNLTAKLSADCLHCGTTLSVNQTVCNHCANAVLWIIGKARRPARAA